MLLSPKNKGQDLRWPGDSQRKSGRFAEKLIRNLSPTKRDSQKQKRGSVREPNQPRGPKDQKISRFRARLKISSENEIFERATHRGPIFCGEFETSRLKFLSEIKNFDRDWKFRARSNFFDRWALWEAIRENQAIRANLRIDSRESGHLSL